MKYIYLDYETYYDRDYSLRKITPVEYILDPRFEVIILGVAEGDKPPFVLVGADQVASYFAGLDLNDCVFVTHNALFDMCINAWKFNAVPRLMIDTMSMARALVFHKTGRVSLDIVARHLGIGVKGGALHNVIGMHEPDMRAAGLWESYVEYCLNDVVLCRDVFKKLRPLFPASELVLNDMVIRCTTHPKFHIDSNVLCEHLTQVEADKQQLLNQCGIVNPKELGSNETFASLLRMAGVEPPTKVSLKTGKTGYAFAKTDEGMIELEEHDDPIVQALVQARLGHKSTLEESRTKRLISISQLTWPGNAQQLMPMPLRFSGAHTHRLSGDWKLNMQNLPRGGNLRKSLVAPEGYTVVTVDASQIEARVVAWLAGCHDLVDLFAAGADVYSAFASDVYGFPVNKKNNPNERFVGKQAILGLGFGMGATRFESQIKSDSHKQGITLEGMDTEMANSVVRLYRKKYPAIPRLWDYFNSRMSGLATGSNSGETFGPITFEQQALLLPSGLKLFYTDLQYRLIGEEMTWACTYGGKTKRLFGGKMTENVVQALARIITMDAAVKIRARTSHHGIELAHQVHDELIYVVPTPAVPVFKQLIHTEMKRRPAWALDLPLDAETGSGPSYGLAK